MKRPGDHTPDPPGGRAAERLRMFEDARRPPEPAPPGVRKATTKPARAPKKATAKLETKKLETNKMREATRNKKRSLRDAKQTRRTK